MRTGEAPHRGYSYLGLLFLVALTAAALASLGHVWSLASQREKERELVFRGGEIARAIAAYVRATPNLSHRYPRRLEDLLVDSRGVKPRHHLRRLYPDPFTGLPDWELVPAPGDPSSFSAVRSRSDKALLGQYFAEGVDVRQARDMVFSPP